MIAAIKKSDLPCQVLEKESQTFNETLIMQKIASTIILYLFVLIFHDNCFIFVGSVWYVYEGLLLNFLHYFWNPLCDKEFHTIYKKRLLNVLKKPVGWRLNRFISIYLIIGFERFQSIKWHKGWTDISRAVNSICS